MRKEIMHVQGVWQAALVAALFAGGGVATAGDAGGREIAPGATDMPTVVPSKQETPDSVFAKLDSGQKGYLSLADVTVLPGFDRIFQKSDTNHDGKLTRKEFTAAWPAYTGDAGAPDAAGGAK